jgi:hypothetical protein
MESAGLSRFDDAAEGKRRPANETGKALKTFEK